MYHYASRKCSIGVLEWVLGEPRDLAQHVHVLHDPLDSLTKLSTMTSEWSPGPSERDCQGHYDHILDLVPKKVPQGSSAENLCICNEIC
jgi:hypothetical protein